MSEREYAVSYQYEGKRFGLTIFATDEADVSRRLRAIGMTGSVDGELVATITFPQAPSFISKLTRIFRK